MSGATCEGGHACYRLRDNARRCGRDRQAPAGRHRGDGHLPVLLCLARAKSDDLPPLSQGLGLVSPAQIGFPKPLQR